jgi:ABC-type proline/glycine betaine transport system substrate-binding protein
MTSLLLKTLMEASVTSRISYSEQKTFAVPIESVNISCRPVCRSVQEAHPQTLPAAFRIASGWTNEDANTEAYTAYDANAAFVINDTNNTALVVSKSTPQVKNEP